MTHPALTAITAVVVTAAAVASAAVLFAVLYETYVPSGRRARAQRQEAYRASMSSMSSNADKNASPSFESEKSMYEKDTLRMFEEHSPSP